MKVKRSNFKVMAAQGGTSGSYVIIGWNGDKDQEVAGSNNPTSLQSIFNEAEKIGKSGKYEDIEIHISFKQGVKSSAYAGKHPIRAARTETIQYYDFNELSEEQKQQAVKWFIEKGPAQKWYDDDMMFWYEENLQELADTTSKEIGVKIHEDKLYWQSNSQGPYPEWRLDDVFGDYDEVLQDDDGSEIAFGASFYGASTDVKFEDIWVEKLGYGATGVMHFDSPSDVQDAGYPIVADYLDNVLAKAQEFIDEVWRRVNEVCTTFPDETWAYETLEANNYEFRVDDNGNVISMA